MDHPNSSASSGRPGDPSGVFRRDGDVPTLVVRGEIDFPNLGEFRYALGQMLRDADSSAVADLSGVTYCASEGITVIAGMARRAANSGKRLFVVPSPVLHRLITTTGLRHLLPNP